MVGGSSHNEFRFFPSYDSLTDSIRTRSSAGTHAATSHADHTGRGSRAGGAPPRRRPRTTASWRRGRGKPAHQSTMNRFVACGSALGRLHLKSESRGRVSGGVELGDDEREGELTRVGGDEEAAALRRVAPHAIDVLEAVPQLAERVHVAQRGRVRTQRRAGVEFAVRLGTIDAVELDHGLRVERRCVLTIVSVVLYGARRGEDSGGGQAALRAAR
jgi:hypothetical protein